MNEKAILKSVEKLHSRAREIGSGQVKINKEVYKLNFNGHSWVATCPDGEEITYNTRKISVAKNWLKEYFGS